MTQDENTLQSDPKLEQPEKRIEATQKIIAKQTMAMKEKMRSLATSSRRRTEAITQSPDPTDSLRSEFVFTNDLDTELQNSSSFVEENSPTQPTSGGQDPIDLLRDEFAFTDDPNTDLRNSFSFVEEKSPTQPTSERVDPQDNNRVALLMEQILGLVSRESPTSHQQTSEVEVTTPTPTETGVPANNPESSQIDERKQQTIQELREKMRLETNPRLREIYRAQLNLILRQSNSKNSVRDNIRNWLDESSLRERIGMHKIQFGLEDFSKSLPNIVKGGTTALILGSIFPPLAILAIPELTKGIARIGLGLDNLLRGTGNIVTSPLHFKNIPKPV